MIKYFLDCEFIEHDKLIDLISIGIVSSDGRELYLQSVEFDFSKANEYVMQNVFPHLQFCNADSRYPFINEAHYHKKHGKCMPYDQCSWCTHKQIKDEIVAFINAEDDKPEFWGWITSYDFLVLCQIFGGFANLPSHWPHYIREFQAILDDRNISDDQLPQQEGKTHNALEDARHLKKLWGYIMRNDAWQ